MSRFEPGNISNEVERTTQFVVGLRIYIRFVVATFAYRTLAEVVMKALKCKHAHESRHQARDSGQAARQSQRKRAKIIKIPNSRDGGLTRM